MEINIALFLNLSIALALGALIGTEREMSQKHTTDLEFSGLRTYTFISLLGFLGALTSTIWGGWILLVLLILVGFFLIVAYKNEFKELKHLGITSELSALVVFLIGALSYVSPHFAATLGVITAVILALKYPLRKFTKALAPQEFFAAIKFIIIAFIVLPLLPTTAIDPWGIMVPYHIWLMVVFISAISFVGYILTKWIGAEKGLNMTGLVGGLASSTATTLSMATQSKRNLKIVIPFVTAVIISSLVMFVRVGFEVFVINRSLLPTLIIPLGVMIATGLIIVGVLWVQSHSKKTVQAEELKLSSPFQFWPALQFGLFYIFVLAFAHFANLWFGEEGLYLASAVSGLADVDAITISMSQLSGSGKLAMGVASKAIVIAVMMNTVVKLVMAWIFGGRTFAWRMALAFGIIFMSGIVTILVM